MTDFACDRNFGSVLRWTGGSFTPMLQPSEYRRYLKPGMKKPWVPSYSMIRWEEEEDIRFEIPTEASPKSGVSNELRKREPDVEEEVQMI
jgi:hypothetical protein